MRGEWISPCSSLESWHPEVLDHDLSESYMDRIPAWLNDIIHAFKSFWKIWGKKIKFKSFVLLLNFSWRGFTSSGVWSFVFPYVFPLKHKSKKSTEMYINISNFVYLEFVFQVREASKTYSRWYNQERERDAFHTHKLNLWFRTNNKYVLKRQQLTREHSTSTNQGQILSTLLAMNYWLRSKRETPRKEFSH